MRKHCPGFEQELRSDGEGAETGLYVDEEAIEVQTGSPSYARPGSGGL
jgi:hypothetical protein